MNNSTNYYHVPMYFRGKMLKEIHTLKQEGYPNDKIIIFLLKKATNMQQLKK